MSTKAIARKIANITGCSYSDALDQVRASIIDLRIERTSYHAGLRAWIIGTRDASMLIDMLTD